MSIIALGDLRDQFQNIDDNTKNLESKLLDLEEKIETIESVISDGVINTQLTGSNMELYGVAIEDRPDANTVPAGATFTIVDRDLDKNWISDGTNWEEV